jgi:PAS domain S-box-containing protein
VNVEHAAVELLRGAFEAAPDGMIVVDAAGRAVLWNRAFLEMWGLSDEVMALRRPVPPREAAARLVRDPGAFLRELDALRGDGVSQVQGLVEMADGRTLEMHSRPIDLGGGQAGRAWYYRDVTELVRARRQLEEASRLLEAQFEGSPFGIIVVGMDGRFIRASRRFFDMSGLDEAWSRLPVLERMAKLEGLAKDPAAARAFNLRWRSTPDQSYAATFETWDGRYMRVTTQPLRDAAGAVLGQVFFYLDVTTEHRAMLALEEQEERLRRLVEGLDAGVIVVDRARRFPVANATALAILGITRERLAELTLDAETWQAMREDGSPMPFEEFPAEQALRTGQAVHGVVMGVRRGDGRLEWLLVSASPLERGPGGEVETVVTTFYDITERRALEQAMARARHLESLAALSGGVAHRLNNHLTAVIGNAWLLSKGENLTAEQLESVAEIQAVAREAAQLVQDLRAYSAPAGNPGSTAEVNACVADALARFGPGERQRLSVALAASLPPVAGQAEGLAQAVANLVDNALEAGPGAVEVRTALVDAGALQPRRPHRWEPAEPPPGRYVAVFIEDGGEGMDAEALARAFDPFHSTRFQGRGLGLPAALGIARRHGGFVGLESAPGRGTLAVLLLPAAGE